MRTRRLSAAVIAAFVTVAVSSAQAQRSAFDDFGADPAPSQFEAAPSQFEDAPARRAAAGGITGRIELIDRAELAASQNGVIQFDVPEQGTLVKTDEIIAKLDDRVPRANLAVAEAQAASDVDVRQAEAILRVARKEVASAEYANRLSPRTVTPQEIERLRLTQTRSNLDIEKAETEYGIASAREAEAEAVLSTFVIRAPFDGIVRRRFKQRGEAVRQGDPILELVSNNRVSISANLPLSLVPKVRVGQQVQIIPRYGDDRRPMSGVVRLVDTYGDGNAGSDELYVPLLIEVPNPEGRLIVGLLAEVRL